MGGELTVDRNPSVAGEPRPVPPIVWQPSPERIERATITAFARWLGETRGVEVDDYEALWRWSTSDLEAFWQALVEFCEIPFVVPGDRVLAHAEMPGADWFPGARLNFAHALLRPEVDHGRIAIHHASELRELGAITWGELRREVARVAEGLRALGVGEGDRVVAYLPNIPEAVVAFLATASLGAIWSSAAPEFGVGAVVDRFAQIEPKVLFGVDGYRYAGKDVDRRAVLAELLAALPTLEHVVIVPYLFASDEVEPAAWLGGVVPATRFDELGPDTPSDLSFAAVAFDHPLWILYSSGTTGLPKAIVHGHGGVLLELTKLLRLHMDLQRGDRFFWFSTTGWMMWNVVVAGLLTDAEIVVYDGSPGYPHVGALWDFAAEAGITVFGTSAAYIGACAKAGDRPGDRCDLSGISAVGSTGSPLSPEGFDWVSEAIGDVWLFSTSGGTDVATAFVGGVPTLPVHRGELQARALGAAIEAWSPAGEPLTNAVGELVVTKPLPSMPVFFWNDPDGAKLRASYLDMWPGVWRHGDWIEVTDRGTAVISGRSDATINRAGVRMGTSEIYRAVLALDDVADALVVDVPAPGTDGVMTLFVVPAPGCVVDDALRERVRAAIRSHCSPRHVPDEIVEIAVVPRTLSGKTLEIPVKRILMGASATDVASADALADPTALAQFERFAARRTAPGGAA